MYSQMVSHVFPYVHSVSYSAIVAIAAASATWYWQHNNTDVLGAIIGAIHIVVQCVDSTTFQQNTSSGLEQGLW